MALSGDDVTMIQQLYAAYCLAIDDADGDAFSACFTADGSLGGAGAIRWLVRLLCLDLRRGRGRVFDMWSRMSTSRGRAITRRAAAIWLPIVPVVA